MTIVAPAVKQKKNKLNNNIFSVYCKVAAIDYD